MKRLIISRDERIMAGDASVHSCHPTLNDSALARYAATGLPLVLVARVDNDAPAPSMPELHSPLLEVAPLRDNPKRTLPRRIMSISLQLLRISLTRADTVIVRLPETVSVLMWFRAKLAGALIVSNLVADPRAPVLHASKPIQVAALLTVRGLVRRSDAVIFVHRESQERLVPVRSQQPVLSMTNAVLGRGQLSAAPREYRHGVGSRKFINVATHHTRTKGITELITAFSRLPGNHELHLVGHGRLHDELVKVATEMQCRGRVIFHGLVTSDRVQELLDSCDVFMLPSHTEGLSRALLEAMSRGLLCLGSDIPSTALVIPRDCLFPVGDERAMQVLMSRAIADPVWATERAAAQYAIARRVADESSEQRFAEFILSVPRGDR